MVSRLNNFARDLRILFVLTNCHSFINPDSNCSLNYFPVEDINSFKLNNITDELLQAIMFNLSRL